jgi:hypothetical protein
VCGETSARERQQGPAECAHANTLRRRLALPRGVRPAADACGAPARGGARYSAGGATSARGRARVGRRRFAVPRTHARRARSRDSRARRSQRRGARTSHRVTESHLSTRETNTARERQSARRSAACRGPRPAHVLCLFSRDGAAWLPAGARTGCVKRGARGGGACVRERSVLGRARRARAVVARGAARGGAGARGPHLCPSLQSLPGRACWTPLPPPPRRRQTWWADAARLGQQQHS